LQADSLPKPGSGGETKFFHLGEASGLTAKAELAVPHSKTLRVDRAQAMCRQVVERARASAASPLAPAAYAGAWSPSSRGGTEAFLTGR